MALELTGPEGVPFDYLRTMVATSATFRAWVGATTGDEAAKLAAAKARVHLSLKASPTRPFALLGFGSGLEARLEGFGPTETFAWQGEVELQLAKDLGDAGPEDAEGLVAFGRDAGLVLQEVLAQSGEAGKLHVRSAARGEPPWIGSIEADDARGHYGFVTYVVKWGL